MGEFVIFLALGFIGYGVSIMMKPLGTATDKERDLAILYPVGIFLLLIGMGMVGK